MDNNKHYFELGHRFGKAEFNVDSFIRGFVLGGLIIFSIIKYIA